MCFFLDQSRGLNFGGSSFFFLRRSVYVDNERLSSAIDKVLITPRLKCS